MLGAHITHCSQSCTENRIFTVGRETLQSAHRRNAPCLIPCPGMKTEGEWRYSSTHPSSVSTYGRFIERKQPPVPSGQATGWATEPVWVVARRKIADEVQLSHCANWATQNQKGQDTNSTHRTTSVPDCRQGKVVQKIPAGTLVNRKRTPVKWKPAPHL